MQKHVASSGRTPACQCVNDGNFLFQAILCRYQSESKKHVSIPLSKDHNPTNYDERMRIQKAGGSVRYWSLLCCVFCVSVIPS